MRACHKRTLAALPLRLRRHSSAISWLPMLLGFFSLKTAFSRSSASECSVTCCDQRAFAFFIPAAMAAKTGFWTRSSECPLWVISGHERAN